MRPPARTSPPRPGALIALALLSGLTGCARLPDAPVLTSSSLGGADGLSRPAAVAPSAVASADPRSEVGLFLRLAVGNHATATRVFRFRILETGSTEPGPWVTIHDQWERTIEGVEQLGDETYFAERNSFVEDDGNRGEFVDLERQDRSGFYLYQEDVPTAGHSLALAPEGETWRAHVLAVADRRLAVLGTAARHHAAYVAAVAALAARTEAARTGAGIAAHEITLLRYPLRPGATWDGRVGFNVYTVEAREPVVVPAGRFAAVRLRIDIPQYFGPRDRYAIWYAEAGEVAHAAHLESPATDENGQVIGTVESDDEQQLTSWEPAAGR